MKPKQTGHARVRHGENALTPYITRKAHKEKAKLTTRPARLQSTLKGAGLDTFFCKTQRNERERENIINLQNITKTFTWKKTTSASRKETKFFFPAAQN